MIVDNIEQARQAGASQNIFSPLATNNPGSPQPQTSAKYLLTGNQSNMPNRMSQNNVNFLESINNA